MATLWARCRPGTWDTAVTDAVTDATTEPTSPRYAPQQSSTARTPRNASAYPRSHAVPQTSQ